VPWENVFIFRDIKKANGFFPIAQVLAKICSCKAPRASPPSSSSSLALFIVWRNRTGTIGFRGVQEKLGEAVANVHMMNALVRCLLVAGSSGQWHVALHTDSLWA